MEWRWNSRRKGKQPDLVGRLDGTSFPVGNRRGLHEASARVWSSTVGPDGLWRTKLHDTSVLAAQTFKVKNDNNINRDATIHQPGDR